MPGDTEDAASKGLKKKLLVVAAFLVSLGAVVGAINTVLTSTKPWVCGIGLPFSWCERPPAADTWSRAVGGVGGSEFDPITCPSGQVLVGLSGRAVSHDPFIRSIGPICAVAHFDRKNHLVSVAVGKVSGRPEVGTGAGEHFELKCSPNTVVVGLELSSDVLDLKLGFGWQAYLVAPLVLKCSSILSSEDESKITVVLGSGERRPNAKMNPFSCPDGLAGFGLRGRSQVYVDAL